MKKIKVTTPEVDKLIKAINSSTDSNTALHLSELVGDAINSSYDYGYAVGEATQREFTIAWMNHSRYLQEKLTPVQLQIPSFVTKPVKKRHDD